MNFKPGDQVTAIYTNMGERRVLLMRLTKVGRKYLHGITQWVDQDGTVREGHPTKVSIEKSVIYPGLRKDLRAAEYKYRADYQQWKNQREKCRRDAEWELRTFVQDRMDEWVKKNPGPQRPELPAPEVETDG